MRLDDLAAGALWAIIILMFGFIVGRVSNDNMSIEQCLKATVIFDYKRDGGK